MSETEIKAAIAQQEEHLKRIRPCQGRMLASHQFEPHRPAGHTGSFHRDEVISRCIICGVTETDDDYQRSLKARATGSLTAEHYQLLATYADGRVHIWDATSLTGRVCDLEDAGLIEPSTRADVQEHPWAYRITEQGRAALASMSETEDERDHRETEPGGVGHEPMPEWKFDTPETERHDYEPGDAHHPMHTDPLCRVCGRPARDRIHD